jgi:hypothetical protein
MLADRLRLEHRGAGVRIDQAGHLDLAGTLEQFGAVAAGDRYGHRSLANRCTSMSFRPE